MISQPTSFIPAVAAFLISACLTFLTFKFAYKFNLVDDPKVGKHPKNIHTSPIPRLGGLPIFITLVLTSLIFLPVDKHLAGILIGGALTIMVGIMDDLFDLNPYLRLLSCFAAAAVVVASGIGIAFLTNPLGGIIDLSAFKFDFFFLGEQRSLWIFSSLFALIWITWCMNFIGWSGGVAGQLPGFVSIAALTIGLLSLRFSADITQWPVFILALITSGAYFGFLPFNFHPQKIMPGYSGKSLAGFLLAVLSILAAAKVGTLIVVLGLPLVDSIFVITRRILAGKSPVWGDNKHLHHQLLELGVDSRIVAAFYWLTTAILGFLALNLNSAQKFYTIIATAGIFGGIALWLNYFTKSSSPADQDNGLKT